MATFEKREGKKGTSYKAKIRISGFPTQTKTFERLTDAKAWATEIERAIKRGEFQNVITAAKSHTLADVIARYKRDILPHKSPTTQRGESTLLNTWDNLLGQYALSYVNTDLISQKMRDIAHAGDTRGYGNTNKPKSPRTLKHYQTCLSNLFRAAQGWGWLGSNPVEKMQKPKKLKSDRTRFLDDSEREKLLKACKEAKNKSLYPIVIIALSTGARLGEILKLELSDIDMARGVAILRDTKNGETRVIPIVQHCKEVLEQHIPNVKAFYQDKPDLTPYLFPRSDGLKPIDIRKAWEGARDKAEITDFRFHDLRHSAASYLAMNGATLIEIADVLGHKTLQMVKRYSHLSESHTADIVSKMNKKIF